MMMVMNQQNADDSVTSAVEFRRNRRNFSAAGSTRQSNRQLTRVFDGYIIDGGSDISGLTLLQNRIPSAYNSCTAGRTMFSSDLIEEEDGYEDWKQIDGIFASMGVDGDVTEQSFLQFLHKDRRVKDDINVWLTRIGLAQYENVLILNGFDHIETLNGVLDEEDLNLMGFTNTEHVTTIMNEVSKLPSLQPLQIDNLPSSVDDWLSSLKLEKYQESFYSKGYDTMSRVLQLWEFELISVLSVYQLGHQKRILISLSSVNNLGSSSGGQHQGHRVKVSDISHVIQLHSIKINKDREDDLFYKRNFQHLHPKSKDSLDTSLSNQNSSPLLPSKSQKGSTSLDRSDSGCSISSGSGTTPPRIPERRYKLEELDTSSSNGFPVPAQRIQTGEGTPYNGSATLPHKHSTDQSYGRQFSDNPLYGSTPDPHYNTIGGRGVRSQSTKEKQAAAGINPNGYMTVDGRRGKHAMYSSQNGNFYNSPDYANMAGQGQPLVANIDGLKLSQAQVRSRRVLNKIKRPLPDLPANEPIRFTVADLPPDFKGRHKPELLIDGCINYSSCYLGTCLVKNITGPESSREAISKMKAATENVSKLPIVALSISFKGVGFIDNATKRPICDHEITNIYCAAQDNLMMNYFAYITKDVLTRGLYCHVFCVKSEELAREIIMTLGEAFDIAFYAGKKHPSLLNPDS